MEAAQLEKIKEIIRSDIFRVCPVIEVKVCHTVY